MKLSLTSIACLMHIGCFALQLIMDGNSRWATARGLPAWMGHERGVSALRTAVVAAWEWGVSALTVGVKGDPVILGFNGVLYGGLYSGGLQM